MFTKIRAIYDILKEIENGGRDRERRRTMDIRLGDKLTMKKAHPCGSKQWTCPARWHGFSSALLRLRA